MAHIQIISGIKVSDLVKQFPTYLAAVDNGVNIQRTVGDKLAALREVERFLNEQSGVRFKITEATRHSFEQGQGLDILGIDSLYPLISSRLAGIHSKNSESPVKTGNQSP